jgi:superfamily II DNA or RNA helicase
MLRQIALPAQMSKGIDDVAGNFYLPCMRASIDYARVTGYFSSGVYLIAWPAIRAFVEGGGHIRIVCSPVLADRDIDALYAGYRARDDEALTEELIGELLEMLTAEELRRPTQALAALIADGIVDVRLAFLGQAAPAATKRIFHDKVGIFTDTSGDSVGFRGTMNETFLGLSSDGNLDSIDIFPSWVGGRDEERLRDAAMRFEQLWSGTMPEVEVREIPNQAIDELRRLANRGWREIVEELEATASIPLAVGGSAQRRPLHTHQSRALAAWRQNGRRGILEHATGSGKTTTALEAIRERLGDGEPAVVVVPSDALLRQWTREIQIQLGDLQPRVLRCGAGSREWASGMLRTWLRRPASEARIALAVINTAAKQPFRDQLEGLPFLLVVDEVHRAGSREFQNLLTVGASSRLGLSATPRRFGDPDGTDRLLDYFGGVVDTYRLDEAITDGLLTPYTYEPHVVALTAEEQDQWDALSRQIGRRVARLGRTGDGGAGEDRQLRLMLIRRARIAKAARGKDALALSVLRDHFRDGDRWLVYCDDSVQLERIRAALSTAGFANVLAYFDAMPGDPALTIRDFELNGGVLVAIKCLDEGVDIPGASHALILASSKNPREFIQRRGRILRKALGKHVSHLHDSIVTPAQGAPGGTFDSMLWSELARGLEFGKGAINPQSQIKLQEIASDLHLDVRLLADLGFEDDEGAEE